MKKSQLISTEEQMKQMLRITIGLILLIFFLGGGWVWSYLQPKGHITCDSFGSYWPAAQAAFIAGDSWLDGNKDNIACNHLYDVYLREHPL